MHSITKLWKKLQDKEYRDGYSEAQLAIDVPFQIRALRQARGLTQAQLAELSGIPQARISHVEQPGRDPMTIRTLQRLASAFDVGLLVEFVPFSELIRREAVFDPKTFSVPSYGDDKLFTTGEEANVVIARPAGTSSRWETRRKYIDAPALMKPHKHLPGISAYRIKEMKSLVETYHAGISDTAQTSQTEEDYGIQANLTT